MKVQLLDLGTVKETEYTRVVCVTRYKEKWIYCKKKGKNTWEIPGGHIEKGEDWYEAAKRELYEEAGVIKANIKPICVYKISDYALLAFAEVIKMGQLPDFEMDEVGFFEEEPTSLSYPESHRIFFKVVKEKLGLN